MATVTLTFYDGKDNEQVITFHSDRNVSVNDDRNQMTSAEYLAVMAVDLLNSFIEKTGGKLSIEKSTDESLN